MLSAVLLTLGTNLLYIGRLILVRTLVSDVPRLVFGVILWITGLALKPKPVSHDDSELI